MEPIFRSVRLKCTHGGGGVKKFATEFMMLKKAKMIQLTFKGLADVNYTHQFKTFLKMKMVISAGRGGVKVE